MRKTKKIEEQAVEIVEKQIKVVRDMTKRNNTTIARMIRNNEIPQDNWEYWVRKMGYDVRAIRILLGGDL